MHLVIAADATQQVAITALYFMVAVIFGILAWFWMEHVREPKKPAKKAEKQESLEAFYRRRPVAAALISGIAFGMCAGLVGQFVHMPVRAAAQLGVLSSEGGGGIHAPKIKLPSMPDLPGPLGDKNKDRGATPTTTTTPKPNGQDKQSNRP